ncbi:translation initiation factor IF-2-like [Schistocerca americana]|uniref:translation initiation factor IF-2-like n=1 Tax=Schistocerca americana TaxID=7009 RepID=UPI001F4F6563|nr:translation initiation factor IF-2-like [Schistocerca americana]
MKRGPGESRIPLFRAAAAPRQAFAAPAPAEPAAVEAHLPHLQQRPRPPQELAEAALRQAGQLPSVPGKAGLSLHSPPRATGAGAGAGDSGADADGAEAPAAPKAHKGAGRVATIFGALRKLAPQAGGGKREEPAPPAEATMPGDGDGDAWQRFAAPQLPRPARPAGAAPAPAPAFARSALRKGGDQPRGAAPLPRSASATTKLHERRGDTYTVASGRQTAATLALYRGVADDDPAPTPAARGAAQEVTPSPEEQFQNAAPAAAGAAYRKRPSLLGLFGGAAPASGGVAVAVASTSSGTTSPVGSGQKARKGSGGRWQPLYSSTPFRPPPDAGTGSEAATPEDDRLRMRTARCAAVAPRAVARGRHEQEETCHVVRTRQEQEESGGGATTTSTRRWKQGKYEKVSDVTNHR